MQTKSKSVLRLMFIQNARDCLRHARKARELKFYSNHATALELAASWRKHAAKETP